MLLFTVSVIYFQAQSNDGMCRVHPLNTIGTRRRSVDPIGITSLEIVLSDARR